ncbi:MAG: malto-oligosyltrehalose trehalohydrolase, partial [Verrucomicrobiota bacterium]
DGLTAGGRYAFRLDDDPHPYPDPASRFQPDGPHGPSELVDPATFAWTDGAWKGIAARGSVVYEMHVGTFTPEGTYAAAAERLPLLADVGVTVVEMMPVAEFAGRFGWGYDGVDLWAPTRLYGRPDDLRRFVDRAHALGIGVILDVVYNHFGPDGNYLTKFSNTTFSDKYENEWGEPINFDGPGSAGMRQLCIENAGYWVDEFHFDGLRLDATQQIFDASPDHLVAAIARRVRSAAGGRGCLLVAENEPQETRLVRAPEAGGYGLDALWNDDFHHTARVALTGHNEAYYSDYRGTPQEILSAVKWGYLYQGQRYAWQKKRRGTPALDLPASAFVTFLENHDQVANSARGERLTTMTSPAMLRAMTAVILLGPGTPMLFQGQEWGSTRPFVYFADHKPELAKAVDEGRRKFLSQFPSCATEAAQSQILTPHDEATFAACKLDWAERERNRGWLALHRDLLRLRREDQAFARGDCNCIHGAVVDRDALVLRFACPTGDRLLLVNLGRDLSLGSIAEPLLAPPYRHRWRTLWSSEEPQYGGQGTGPVESDAGFTIPGQAAVVLAPEAIS